MKELKALIFASESESLDFKKRITHPDRIARTLAAFANTRGGQILVGLLDNGQVTGIDPEEEMHLLSRAAEKFCDPPVKLSFRELEEEDKTLLLVTVSESSQKPHLVKVAENDWREFIRVKDQTLQTGKILPPAMGTETAITKSPVIPDPEKLLLAYLKKYPQISEKQFMQLADIPQRQARQILLKLLQENAIRESEKDADHYLLF